MPDDKETEPREAGVVKIDMRALERGVMRALAIEPTNPREKKKPKKKQQEKK